MRQKSSVLESLLRGDVLDAYVSDSESEMDAAEELSQHEIRKDFNEPVSFVEQHSRAIKDFEKEMGYQNIEMPSNGD